jgi:hypothetical protein
MAIRDWLFDVFFKDAISKKEVAYGKKKNHRRHSHHPLCQVEK